MLKSGLYTYLLIAMQQCCQRLPVRQCECILFAYSNLTCNPAGRPDHLLQQDAWDKAA